MPKIADPTRKLPEGLYRIAAVSKLANMPVPTIRMWERRYEVVTPARSAANGRLYSRADIDRLILLKSAVDAGHAIGTVAALTNEQIGGRLREASTFRPSRPQRQCRVIACGSGLSERLLKSWANRSDMQLVASMTNVDARLPEGIEADALIVQMPTLQVASIQALRQLRVMAQARMMIVVHGFASRQALSRLDQENILAIGQPADPSQLARICQLGLDPNTKQQPSDRTEVTPPAAPRRFDEMFLATVARLPTTVRCECPNHLADLLTKLNGFEQYSLECENSDPADASVHAMLYASAAHCRQVLEQALQSVLEHEGIPLPQT